MRGRSAVIVVLLFVLPSHGQIAGRRVELFRSIGFGGVQVLLERED